MKNRITIIVLILLFTFIGYLIYDSKQRDKIAFNRYDFTTSTNYVINQGPKPYLDTIIHAGMDVLNIKNHPVLIRTMDESRAKIGDEIVTYAYIISDGYRSVIYITDEISRREAIGIIAHELIHLKQYDERSLVILTGPIVAFRGIPYSIATLPYNERPWEIEAFNEGWILEKTLKEILIKEQ